MKKNLKFILSFFTAKGTVFIAPILLADILSERDFGVLEYALAGIGMLLNAIINLGVTGAYPYFIIKKKKKSIKEGFRLHPIWLALIFLINQFLYFGFSFYALEFFMAINVSYIIANQQFYSVQFKSHGNIFKAVFLDAGIYILLLFFVVCYYAKLMGLSILSFSYGILAYSISFVIYAFYNIFQSEKENIFGHYKKILSFSSHLLISTSFLFFLSVSGRILTKYLFGYEATGVYGFYFRLAAIVVMIHQIISIRFFKDIYTLKPQKLDAYFSYFYVFIFVTSILIYALTPHILPYFSSFFKETYYEYKLLFFVLFYQMIMWIGTALNSNIVDREGLAKKNNLYFLLLFLFSVIFLFFFKNKFTIFSLTFFIYTVFFIANLTQHYTLKTKGIFFKKSFYVLFSIYFISCITIYIMN